MKKHGTDGKRRVWRKLHLAVDTDTHEIIAAELTLSGEVFPNLLKKHTELSRKLREMVHKIQENVTGRLGLRKRYL